MASIAETPPRDERGHAADASTTASQHGADRVAPTAECTGSWEVCPLDTHSRRMVRLVLTKLFSKAPEPDAWKLAPLMDRGALVAKCSDAVRAYMASHPDHAAHASWSELAIAQEVDFYLPKVVAAYMKKSAPGGMLGRHTPAHTYVDVDSDPFREWPFQFASTRERLAADRACRRGFRNPHGTQREKARP